MNQVKYILFACLILVSAIVCFTLAKSLFSNSIIKHEPSAIVIDYYLASDALSESETEGRKLFENNCNVCHRVGGTDNFFIGFENRGPWGDRKELYKWIRNPIDYIANDKTGYTLALKEKYGVLMASSPHLSDSDIDKILDYLQRMSVMP